MYIKKRTGEMAISVNSNMGTRIRSRDAGHGCR